MLIINVLFTYLLTSRTQPLKNKYELGQKNQDGIFSTAHSKMHSNNN